MFVSSINRLLYILASLLMHMNTNTNTVRVQGFYPDMSAQMAKVHKYQATEYYGRVVITVSKKT